jgi:hypothetical protein
VKLLGFFNTTHGPLVLPGFWRSILTILDPMWCENVGHGCVRVLLDLLDSRSMFCHQNDRLSSGQAQLYTRGENAFFKHTRSVIHALKHMRASDHL